VRVEGQFTFNATAQMLNAALTGAGLAYVPESMVQRDLAKGRLRRALEEWCLPYSGYHLFYPSRRQSSAAFALMSMHCDIGAQGERGVSGFVIRTNWHRRYLRLRPRTDIAGRRSSRQVKAVADYSVWFASRYQFRGSSALGAQVAAVAQKKEGPPEVVDDGPW
jgi:hypothetical protein